MKTVRRNHARPSRKALGKPKLRQPIAPTPTEPVQVSERAVTDLAVRVLVAALVMVLDEIRRPDSTPGSQANAGRGDLP